MKAVTDRIDRTLDSIIINSDVGFQVTEIKHNQDAGQIFLLTFDVYIQSPLLLI